MLVRSSPSAAAFAFAPPEAPPPAPAADQGPPEEYVIGLDLGQAQDFTAVAIAERRLDAQTREASYLLRYLHRYPLQTPYTTIVQDVGGLVARPELVGRAGRPVLVVDSTGVGRPVVDMFWAADLPVVSITITAGTLPAWAPGGGWHVPKRDLVAAVQLGLQQRRLAWSAALPDAGILEAELKNFRVHLSPTGRDTYGAGSGEALLWREGAHDDYVLAVAVAVWAGDHITGRVQFF